MTPETEATVQRLGALMLGRLDRAGVVTRIPRIVLYDRRIAAYHLPLPYRDVADHDLAAYLKTRTGLNARLFATTHGCTLLIDLASAQPTIEPQPHHEGV